MPVSDNFHSLLVGWSKIILPLIALGLLSTMFLFSRASDDTTAIPFAQIAQMAREQKIGAPRFTGVADDGSIIALGAKSARPIDGQANTLLIDDIAITVDATDGSTLDIRAVNGQLDGAAQVARLEGLARVTTSTGYVMETPGLVADLQSGVVTSEGQLEIRAPYGSITAGRIRIETSESAQGQQMLFTQGVHLIYIPQQN